VRWHTRTLGLQFLMSLVFAVIILLIKAAVDLLPYSHARDTVSDFLDFPGMLISSVLYREGIHTGHGSLAWVFVAMAATIIFYIIVGLLIIQFAIKIRSHWLS